MQTSADNLGKLKSIKLELKSIKKTRVTNMITIPTVNLVQILEVWLEELETLRGPFQGGRVKKAGAGKLASSCANCIRS